MSVSLNLCVDFFLDSLTGRSPETRRNYERDLQQFKLYLVLFRPHAILLGDVHQIQELKNELNKSDGKLWDTMTLSRNYSTGLRSQARLDSFDLDVEKLRKEDVVGFFGYLESSKNLGRATLLRRLAALRRFFRMISKAGYNVAPEVVDHLGDMRIRRERTLPIALTADEVLDFLSCVESLRDRAVLIVMLFMGLRVSEVVNLNLDDIKPHSKGLTLLGKGAKERYVPIHPQVHAAVVAYLDVRPEVSPDKKGNPLFVSNRRKRIDTSTVRRFIKRYAQVAASMDSRKKRHLSPHKLRHTFATMLLGNGVDIRYIQELLGHEHLSTTEIYTSVRSNELEQAVSHHPLGASIRLSGKPTEK